MFDFDRKPFQAKKLRSEGVFFLSSGERKLKLKNLIYIFLQKKKTIWLQFIYAMGLIQFLKLFSQGKKSLIFEATQFWLGLFEVAENSNWRGLLFSFSCLFLALFFYFLAAFYQASLLCVCKASLGTRLFSSWDLILNSTDTWD